MEAELLNKIDAPEVWLKALGTVDMYYDTTYDKYRAFNLCGAGKQWRKHSASSLKVALRRSITDALGPIPADLKDRYINEVMKALPAKPFQEPSKRHVSIPELQMDKNDRNPTNNYVYNLVAGEIEENRAELNLTNPLVAPIALKNGKLDVTISGGYNTIHGDIVEFYAAILQSYSAKEGGKYILTDSSDPTKLGDNCNNLEFFCRRSFRADTISIETVTKNKAVAKNADLVNLHPAWRFGDMDAWAKAFSRLNKAFDNPYIQDKVLFCALTHEQLVAAGGAHPDAMVLNMQGLGQLPYAWGESLNALALLHLHEIMQ